MTVCLGKQEYDALHTAKTEQEEPVMTVFC